MCVTRIRVSGELSRFLTKLLCYSFLFMLLMKLTFFGEVSWWVVTAPLWALPAIILTLVILLIVICVGMGLLGAAAAVWELIIAKLEGR